MKLLYILLATILIFGSGCTTQKRIIIVKTKELPSWYSTPQVSNEEILYATGEGKNKEEAIKDALNMMVSTLGVSISSKFDSKVIENMGNTNGYQQTTSSEIQSSIKEIRISNYKLLKSQNISFNRYIVLIKSDKKKLFDSLKKELDTKFNLVENREDCQDTNIVECFRICKEAKISLIDTKNTLVVMGSLQKDFDDSGYIERYNRVNNDYEKLESSISFSIQTDDNSELLKQVILSGLSAKKLQILDDKENISTHLSISINSDVKKASSHGIILARTAISIVVKDFNGVIIGSNKLNITGQSTQGYDLAKESVAQKLNVMVYKDGIEKIIGLSL